MFIKKIFIIVFLFCSACGGYLPGTEPEGEGEEDVIEPAIVSFTSSPASIPLGDSTTLSWDTVSGESISISPDIGEVEATASTTITPQVTTTYTLTLTIATAEGEDPIDPLTATVTVTVTDPDLNETEGLAEGEGVKEDPCVTSAYTEDELKSELSLTASRTSIYEGETVMVSWSSTVTSATLAVYEDGSQISTQTSGSEEVTPSQTTAYQASLTYCGVTAEKELNITVKTWEQSSLLGVSALYAKSYKQAWAGTNSGELYKSEDKGDSWSKVSSARLAYDDGETPITDNSPVKALLKLGSSCDSALFIGTEKGFLYRSYDDGVTVSDSTGANKALQVYATDSSDWQNNPSPINFIVSDPANSSALYVGHQNGLAHILNCKSNAREDYNDVSDENSNVDFQGTNPTMATVFNDNIYLVNTNGFYGSADGATWNQVTQPGSSITWLKSMGGKLYAGTASAIWSYDGSTWSSINISSSTNAYISGSTWFVSKTQGISLSRDGGSSFVDLESDPSQVTNLIYAGLFMSGNVLALDTSGKIYAVPLSTMAVLTAPVLIDNINFMKR